MRAAAILNLVDDGRRLSGVVDAVVAQGSGNRATRTGKANAGREQS
jgi:hypothetical protein